MQSNRSRVTLTHMRENVQAPAIHLERNQPDLAAHGNGLVYWYPEHNILKKEKRSLYKFLHEAFPHK